MIYPDSFEQKLQFEKIREHLAEHCLSKMGQEWVERMAFSNNFEKVQVWLFQTSEMLKIEDDGSEMPASYFLDARIPLKKIRVEGLFLEELELFDLRRSLGTIRDIVRFIQSKEPEEFPYLRELAKDVMIFPDIISKIDAILNKQGKIKDNASPALSQIRREILGLQQSVTRRMASILRQAQKDGWVEADVSVSIRDGRSVIPIPSSNKRKLAGIVHDESATGKTSYIEPTEIVEINNEIREKNYAERREVTRILTEVSNFIRPYIDELFYAYSFLGIVDFIRAKARFSKRINATIPTVKNEPYFNWKDATHPLLFLHHQAQGKEVVPLSLQFTPNQRIVIISGPNAGGKSVCLQTVGLVQYMLQCGLPVPVGEGSTMGFYHQLFLDLGDEQSIENDLSTYSSHLLNMKNFVRYANQQSLLLIDEFGTGTEPMLGGAIAESVLEELNNQGAFGVITTHYTNLKHFASQTPGVVNGAMQFDTHQLQPLFKLEVGSPGSSFAFEIARKIGLPESILANAKERLGEDHIHFDKHLREIIRDKRYWEEKRRSIKDKERRLSSASEKYESELKKLMDERKKIIQQAQKEATTLIAGANKEIENTIRVIRETQAEKEKTRLARKELDSVKKLMDSSQEVDTELQQKLERKMESIRNRKKRTEKRIEKTKKEAKPKAAPVEELGPITEGDMVRLEGQAVPGEVMSLKGNEAVVAFGQLATTVKLNRLQKVSKNTVKKEMRRESSVVRELSNRLRDKKLNFKPDIDVRGMRADEAIDTVERHLDEALMCNVNQVKILHGKGTGALRQMIRDYVVTLPFVSSCADEDIRFGGSGITIVNLD